MKQMLFSIVLLSLLTACSDGSEPEIVSEKNEQNGNEFNRIVGIGKIIPENDIIQLASPVNGIVEEIYKTENDTVSIGSIILVLEHDLEDAKIVQLKNQLNTQSAQINADAASVNEFESKRNSTQSELEHLQNLLEKGAETQQVVNDKTTELQTFNSNVNRLVANVAVSRGRLQETRAAIKTAQVEREQKFIRSPIKGRILELTVLVGSSVASQQSFGQISPEGKTIAMCEIDELNAEKIQVGQRGWVRNIGAADTLSMGTVYFAYSFLKKKSLFTDQSGEKEDRRVRTIKIMLDTPGKLLLNARIECVIDISNPSKP